MSASGKTTARQKDIARVMRERGKVHRWKLSSSDKKPASYKKKAGISG